MRAPVGVEEDDQLIVETDGPADKTGRGGVAGANLARQPAQRIVYGHLRQRVLEDLVDGEHTHRLYRDAGMAALHGDELRMGIVDPNQDTGVHAALGINE